MIRHVVTWKMSGVNEVERSARAAEVARLLNALDGVVPQILAISAGANCLYADANWDVTVVADFDSPEALEQYQVHPAHEEAAVYIRSVAESRVAVDFEV